MLNSYFAPLLEEHSQLDGAAEPMSLTDCGWSTGNNYRPLTVFCCGVIRGQGIAVRLFTQEPEPRAVCTRRDDPVWTDSCLEFFFQPRRGGAYLNLEMNANGAYLAAVGTGRDERRFLQSFTDQTVEVAPFRRADGWGVEALSRLRWRRSVLANRLRLRRAIRFLPTPTNARTMRCSPIIKLFFRSACRALIFIDRSFSERSQSQMRRNNR